MTSADDKLEAQARATRTGLDLMARVAQAVNRNRDEAEAEEADRLDGLEQFDDGDPGPSDEPPEYGWTEDQ